MAQEATYQEYLARSLQEKYSMLGAQLDNVVREANEENGKLLARIEGASRVFKAIPYNAC